MRSFRDVAGPKRPPTPGEEAAINDVYDMVRGWLAGEIDLPEIRAATSGKQRFLATTYTKPDHELFKSLMAMLDALIADNDAAVRVATGQSFTKEEMGEVQAKIVRHEGIEYVQFPMRYPWTTKPNTGSGVIGEPSDPIYRNQDAIFNREPIPPYEKEWWEHNDTQSHDDDLTQDDGSVTQESECTDARTTGWSGR